MTWPACGSVGAGVVRGGVFLAGVRGADDPEGRAAARPAAAPERAGDRAGDRAAREVAAAPVGASFRTGMGMPA